MSANSGFRAHALCLMTMALLTQSCGKLAVDPSASLKYAGKPSVSSVSLSGATLTVFGSHLGSVTAATIANGNSIAPLTLLSQSDSSIRASLGANLTVAANTLQKLSLESPGGLAEVTLTVDLNGTSVSNFKSTGITDLATATAVTISNSGKVGVGTSSPTNSLEVNGGLSLIGSPTVPFGFGGLNPNIQLLLNSTASQSGKAEIGALFQMVSNVGSSNPTENFKTPIASVCQANSGSGSCWGGNFVATMASGAGNIGAVGFEIDLNNSNKDYGGTAGNPYAAGLFISGAGTHYNNAAMIVSGSTPIWYDGILFEEYLTGASGTIVNAAIRDTTKSPNVMIATNSHVNGINFGTATFSQYAFISPNFSVDGSGYVNTNGLRSTGLVTSSTSDQAGYYLYNGGGVAEWIMHQPSASSHNLTFSKRVGAAVSDLMVLNPAGNLGVGTTDPNNRLHVFGSSGQTVAYFSDGTQSCSITPSTPGNISCSSDERLKKDIVRVDDESLLAKLLKISTYEYRWKTLDEKKQTGYIAQKVEEIAPEMVQTGSDGYKQVSYVGFIPWITSSIRALHSEFSKRIDEGNDEINQLKLENEELRIELAEIKHRLDRLEKNSPASK